MRSSTTVAAAVAGLLLPTLWSINAYAQAAPGADPGSGTVEQATPGGHGSTEVNGRDDQDSQAGQKADTSLDSQSFVKRAAQSNLAEIKVSQLAQSQAHSPAVKQFAQKMIDDHTKANSELAQLAQTKNLKVPDDTDLMHKASMKMLQSKSDESFDTAYMKQMDKDHKKTIELFQSAAASPKVDKELQAFASKVLPKLQDHEHQVAQVQSNVPSRSASSQ
jgi:predicted outer membrane protein